MNKTTWPEDLLAAEQQLQLKPDLLINYVDTGQGPILFCLHNSGGFWQIWTKQIRYFSKKYRVIAIDLPQNGKSSRVKDETTLEYFTEVLQLFIQRLKLEQITFLGNCIGSAIALNYSQLYTENVKQLILFNICPGRRLGKNFMGHFYIKYLFQYKWLQKLSYPLLRYFREDSAYQKKFPSILFGKNFNREDEIFTYFCKNFHSYNKRKDRFKDLYALDSFTLDHYLNQADIPDLSLFWGAENQVTSLKKDGHFFAKQLNTDLIEVAKAGHLAMYEQADWVNEKIEHILITKQSN